MTKRAMTPQYRTVNVRKARSGPGIIAAQRLQRIDVDNSEADQVHTLQGAPPISRARRRSWRRNGVNGDGGGRRLVDCTP